MKTEVKYYRVLCSRSLRNVGNLKRNYYDIIRMSKNSNIIMKYFAFSDIKNK